MGECGCTSGNQAFRLKSPDGWYVIELQCGCDYCATGPGIQIHHPESVKFNAYEDEIKEMPILPTIGEGEHCISMIKCGLDPDEAKEAAVRCFSGADLEQQKIDDILAEILGEDFWKNALTKSPSVILPEKQKQ